MHRYGLCMGTTSSDKQAWCRRDPGQTLDWRRSRGKAERCDAVQALAVHQPDAVVKVRHCNKTHTSYTVCTLSHGRNVPNTLYVVHNFLHTNTGMHASIHTLFTNSLININLNLIATFHYMSQCKPKQKLNSVLVKRHGAVRRSVIH